MQAIEEAPTIRQLVIARTPNHWATGENFLSGSDRLYWIPRRQDLRAILDECHIAHHGSQGEIFDCDEYATTMKSQVGYFGLRHRDAINNRPIACGTYWGRATWSPDPLHAGNWFVTREDDLVWIEPQYNNAKARSNGFDPIRPPGDEVVGLRVMIF